MQTITFPEIGIEINLNRIAFSIGSIGIHWYAIFIVSALIIALLFLYKKRNKMEIKFETLVDLMLYLIPISLICARIYYCLFRGDYYFKNPWKIFYIQDGGLAIYGGIIGGALTCYFFCKKRNINFLLLLDYIVPYLALGQAIGRWGNFINVEAYGTETKLPWRMGIIENGIYKEVHPTFLYESIADLLIFFVLIRVNSKNNFNGKTTCLYLILYSLVRFFIEELRTDSLMLYNIKISQILSLALFVAFNILLSKKEYRQRKINANLEK